MTRFKREKKVGFPNPNNRILDDLNYQVDWLEWKLENSKESSRVIWESKISSFKKKFQLV